VTVQLKPVPGYDVSRHGDRLKPDRCDRRPLRARLRPRGFRVSANPQPRDVARGSRGGACRNSEDPRAAGAPGDDVPAGVELRRQLSPVDADGGGRRGESEVNAERLSAQSGEDRETGPGLRRDQVDTGCLPAVRAVEKPRRLRLRLDPRRRGRSSLGWRGQRGFWRARPGERGRDGEAKRGDDDRGLALHERGRGGAAEPAPASCVVSGLPR
jgi:hypothetical protein